MGQPPQDWTSRTRIRATNCWVGTRVDVQDWGPEGTFRPETGLRPPPVFRTIGLTAGLPPHRRLRSIFHRSCAVLPADGHDSTRLWTRTTPTDSAPEEASEDTPAVLVNRHDSSTTGILLRAPAKGPTGPRRNSSVFPESVHVPEGRRSGPGESRTGTAGQTRTERPGETRTGRPGETRTRTAGQTRTERPGETWTGTVGQTRTERPGQSEWESGVCRWLHTLQIQEKEQRVPATGGKGAEAAAHHRRRDRRPHFLPPIAQRDFSLLDVPLFLPEHSPPPSPRGSANGPLLPLDVPLRPRK
ncbi:uncharacterized protein LOC114793684 [Denticeps clupeoides]|uniref:uncharacterized protein LOC114793684 n=1 Tax=Denticeps clupeoides TaxID=299321 RepID=UPI0010A4ACD5|nr:uncharacterized protein LOC114793684 [Denticeps clupeoides]